MTSFATSEIVTVYVGKKRKAYQVHKELLVSKSPYFRGSLISAFPEGRSNEVYLREDTPEAFSWLITWLYSGVVNAIGTKHDACIGFKTCIMADRFLIVSLKNDLVDAIRRFYARQVMGAELLRLLAKHEGFEGELKRFVFDQVAYDLLEYTRNMELDPYLPSGSDRSAMDSFLAQGSSTAIDTFWALRNWAGKEHVDPSSLEGCYYHEHPSGSPVCKFAPAKHKK